jgi:hypothetical protein
MIAYGLLIARLCLANAPGAPKFMHRTQTVECDLELDSGEVAHLKRGDVVVQRGTMHAWANPATVGG